MPRPAFVQELLEQQDRGHLSPRERQSWTDTAVRYMIAMMEATEIDIITDGEWRRHSYTDVIAQMLDGFVPGREGGSNWYTVVEPMSNQKNFIADEARFVKAHTDRKVKVCLPSPFILGQRMWDPEASKTAYPTRREFVRATVPFLRAELEAVRDAGVEVAQIDEPYLSGFCDPRALDEFDDPDTDLDFLVECLNGVVQGVTGITIAVHVCRFNRGRKGWTNEGGYEPILPALNRLQVQQLTLEYSIPVAGDMRVLRDLDGDKQLALGCVDCRSAKVDTPEEIAARVERAMEFVPKERLLLAPDCGFAPAMGGLIPLDEAYVKLKNDAKAAEILRQRHG